MSIKAELHCISVELAQIKESRGRIQIYASELNKYNPFSVGDELVGNECTHYGKTFVVDGVFISDRAEKNIRYSQKLEVTHFSAEGYVKKKDSSLSSYRTSRHIYIVE
tara:strand:- start:137 stop:460 length:324 start_codon:yes stop_codon:yes gene_type:complete